MWARKSWQAKDMFGKKKINLRKQAASLIASFQFSMLGKNAMSAYAPSRKIKDEYKYNA